MIKRTILAIFLIAILAGSAMATTSKPKQVGFSATSVNGGTAPLTVTFVGQSNGGTPTSWVWNFGDGQSATIKKTASTCTVSHRYTKNGYYTVKVTASNSAGSSSHTENNYVQLTTPPSSISYTATPVSGKAPLKVKFVGKSTGSKPSGWCIDYGDGTLPDCVESSSQTFTIYHTYTTKGSFTVLMGVGNVAGTIYMYKSNYVKVY